MSASPGKGEITQILQSGNSNRQSAVDSLTPVVYSELRKLAGSYLRNQRPDHTLQPTALINEAYLRLVDHSADFKDRSHFFALSAKIMRQILVDFARAHQSQKRGSGRKVQLDEGMNVASESASDFIAIHEALDRLQVQDERKAKVVEMSYFGGLQLEEIAVALDVSLATVKRDLIIAKAWLRRALDGDGQPTG